MTLDPNIIMSIGAGANRLQMEGPIDTATRFQQLQRMKQATAMGDMELQNAQEEQAQQRAMREVFARNTNPDGSVNRAGVLSDLGRVNPMARMKMEQTWTAQDAAALKQQIDLKEALAKLDENKRKEIAFNVEQLGRATAFIKGLPEEQRAAAWDRKIDELGRVGIDFSAYRGKYDPQALESMYAQALEVKTAFEDGKFSGWHVGADDNAYQVNNRGQARPVVGFDGKPVKAKAPGGVTVNLGEPKVFADPQTGKQGVYRFGKDGTVQKVDAVVPAEPQKEIPSGVVTNFAENEGLLSTIDQARAMVDKTPNAIGMKTVAPDWLLQRTDPEGANLRALIAQVGSLKYKDLSGAAVTAAEDSRMAPYIPKLTDSPDVVKTKLAGLRRELEKKQTEIATAYKDGHRQIPQFQRYLEAAQPAAAPAAAPKAAAKPQPAGPKAMTPAEVNKLPPKLAEAYLAGKTVEGPDGTRYRKGS